MNINNLIELELYFADHLDSILFPVLAEKYFANGDLKRARKVCNIGLGYHKNDQEGHYILGLVAKEEDQLKEAEKHLLKSVNNPSDHLNALIALCSVQTELERSPKTLYTHWKKVLELDPSNEAAQVFIQRLNMKQKKEATARQKQSPPKSTKPSTAKKQDRSTQNVSKSKAQNSPITISDYKEDTEPIKISNRLATFTMVTVLKNQGLLNQALEVLDKLEEKGESVDRIKKERKEINEFISKQ